MKYMYLALTVSLVGCAAAPPVDDSAPAARPTQPTIAESGPEIGRSPVRPATATCDACRNGRAPEETRAPVTVTPSKSQLVLGNTRAPKEIVVFTDLECPYSARLHATMTAIAAERSDVRVVVRHYPLPMHGEPGKNAARAAIAATQLGKGDAFVRAYFAAQDRDGLGHVDQAARAAGLDPERLTRAMRTPEVEAELARDLEEGARVGVRGTPTSFAAGKRTDGAQLKETFLAEL